MSGGVATMRSPRYLSRNSGSSATLKEGTNATGRWQLSRGENAVLGHETERTRVERPGGSKEKETSQESEFHETIARARNTRTQQRDPPTKRNETESSNRSRASPYTHDDSSLIMAEKGVERIWIEHDELGFVPVIVLGKADDGKTVVQFDSGETATVSIKDPSPVHPSCLTGVADLLALGEFDIGPLLHNVRVRYFKNEIYTAVGPLILISVNPYASIPRLYTSETAAKYRNEVLSSSVAITSEGENSKDDSDVEMQKATTLPPHPFRIAQTALNHLYNRESDQSIIISGESGAGKTEATKIILSYLAEVSGMPGLRVTSPTEKQHTSYSAADRRARLHERQGGAGDSLPGVEVQITESNHLLESFGNAKTLRNDNSSRFGKFTQVYFDLESKKLVGARITNYLLEKSRIVRQQDDERNYHIFYQLCAGRELLDLEIQRSLELTDAEEFDYLNRCTSVPAIDDVDDFEHLLVCFEQMGFTTETQTYIFGLLAGILHLGNAVVAGAPDEENETVPLENFVRNPQAFKKASQLFGVPPNDLLRLLQYKTIPDVMTGRKIAVPRTDMEAASAKDALSKAIYERLFQWLVDQVNSVLAVSFGTTPHGNRASLDGRPTRPARPLSSSTRRRANATQGSIGLLDIFGFEVFEVNSFEQLCINFANEQLQQHFNLHVFREEQNLYQNEGIDWTQIKFEDNQKILDALTNRVYGIFPMLDSECLVPKATDSTFLSKVLNAASTVEALIKPTGLKRASQFGVAHYAGPVYYSPTGLLDKNRDRVHQDVFDCFGIASSQLLKELFTDPHHTPTSPNNRSKRASESEGRCRSTFMAAAGRSGFTNTSVSYTFREQLTGLIRVLGMTTASYIRCIKPNGLKAALTFDSLEVLRQLKCAGMLESIRIRKAGYPIRLDIRSILMRYRVLLSPAELKAVSAHPPPEHQKRLVNQLLTRITKDTGILVSNKTKWTQKELWQVGKTKVFMKDHFQALLERRAAIAWSAHVTTISRYWRGYVAAKRYRLVLEAAETVQSWSQYAAMHRGFQEYIKMRDAAARRIQDFWRTYLNNQQWHCLKHAVGIISRAWKRKLIHRRRRELAARAVAGEALTPTEWARGCAIFDREARRRASLGYTPSRAVSGAGIQRPVVPPLRGLKKVVPARELSMDMLPSYSGDDQTDLTYDDYEPSLSPRDSVKTWRSKRAGNRRRAAAGRTFAPPSNAGGANASSSSFMKRLLALMDAEKEKSALYQKQIASLRAEKEEYFRRAEDIKVLELDFARRLREKQIALERAQEEIRQLKEELAAECDQADALEDDVDRLTAENNNLAEQLAEKENHIQMLIEHLEKSAPGGPSPQELQEQICTLNKKLVEAEAMIQLRTRQLVLSKPPSSIGDENLSSRRRLNQEGTDSLSEESPCCKKECITARDTNAKLNADIEESNRQLAAVYKIAKHQDRARQSLYLKGNELLKALKKETGETPLIEELRNVLKDMEMSATDALLEDGDVSSQAGHASLRNETRGHHPSSGNMTHRGSQYSRRGTEGPDALRGQLTDRHHGGNTTYRNYRGGDDYSGVTGCLTSRRQSMRLAMDGDEPPLTTRRSRQLLEPVQQNHRRSIASPRSLCTAGLTSRKGTTPSDQLLPPSASDDNFFGLKPATHNLQHWSVSPESSKVRSRRTTTSRANYGQDPDDSSQY